MRFFPRKFNPLDVTHSAAIAFFGAVVAWQVSAQATNGQDTPPDLVSIGGSVTEIVYALDQQHRLIARDTTSIYPPEVLDLPDVGYIRALSPEGVLSMGPEIVIAEEGARPQEAVDVLRAASIEFVEVPDAATPDGVIEKIRVVGEALGVGDKADALASSVAADLETVIDMVAAQDVDKRRVLFVLSTRGGRVMASGTDTAAHAIIDLAGGVNVIDSFPGYKALTDEAVTAAAPDIVLMMGRGGNHSSTNEELWSMPALRLTPAAENDAVVRMNGLLLLGFGPRTPAAIDELHRALYESG